MASSIASRRISSIARSFLLYLTARGLQHLLLLLTRFLDHVRADLLPRLPPLGDDALRVVARAFDLPLLLGESLRGGFAIPLRAFDRFLEGFLARFHGRRDLREYEPAEDDEQDYESDQCPEHQATVRRQQVPGLTRFLGCDLCRLQKCKENVHGCLS